MSGHRDVDDSGSAGSGDESFLSNKSSTCPLNIEQQRSSQRIQSKMSRIDNPLEATLKDKFDFTQWVLCNGSTIPTDDFKFDKNPNTDFPRYWIAAALVLVHKKRTSDQMERTYENLKNKHEKFSGCDFRDFVENIERGAFPSWVNRHLTDKERKWLVETSRFENAKALAASTYKRPRKEDGGQRNSKINYRIRLYL